MFDAIGFYYSGLRKKKSKYYIIPPAFLKGACGSSSQELAVDVDAVRVAACETKVAEAVLEQPEETAAPAVALNAVAPAIPERKVSALSLTSIRAKREMEASMQKRVVNLEDLPKEPFTLDQVMEQWHSYANKLGKSGLMLMCSLMGMCNPQLKGAVIDIELPNEGSKLSFDENKYDLVNFLRKKLSNYDIEIHIAVNEEITIKRAFTPEDKYKHLNKINPALETLVRTFELDITKM